MKYALVALLFSGLLNGGNKEINFFHENRRIMEPTEKLNPDMLNLVNEYRSRGCNCGGRYMPPAPPLQWNDKIEQAALRHATDMKRYSNYSHKGTDGSQPDSRLDQASYQWSAVAENIAWGYYDFRSVLIGWIKSPSHCKNLMSTKFTEFGAARYGDCWVQDFAKPFQ